MTLEKRMDDLDYRKDLYSRVFIYNEERDLDDSAIRDIRGDTFEVLQLFSEMHYNRNRAIGNNRNEKEKLTDVKDDII